MAIKHHAEQDYAHECCGLLIGQTVAGQDGCHKTLQQVCPTRNSWQKQRTFPQKLETSTQRRYWIEPVELLQTQKVARTLGCDIIGVYHSHPDHPAVPSECDRNWAWPQYSYIIVSVQQGIACDLRSWMLDEQGFFQPESIVVMDTDNGPP
jgi:proteasome lid subunit RPN8/RPN11